MKRNWLIVILLVVLVSILYIIEMSKMSSDRNMPTLDNLQIDEFSKNWEPFYKVRATIIDGQSANFTFPKELENFVGKELSLSGVAAFFGNGCEMLNDTITQIRSFYLLPTLGLANSCGLNAAESMRWTVLVNLAKPWVLNRNDMVNTEAIVTGEFRIDTSKPYEAAFYLDAANAKLK